ncbi:hypothetical protein DFH06DRAFT_1169814 [Mycena polygramma]|nr:hypothetical protein DFH06DRAFT_1169814 [Mycena polygramma]
MYTCRLPRSIRAGDSFLAVCPTPSSSRLEAGRQWCLGVRPRIITEYAHSLRLVRARRDGRTVSKREDIDARILVDIVGLVCGGRERGWGWGLGMRRMGTGAGADDDDSEAADGQRKGKGRGWHARPPAGIIERRLGVLGSSVLHAPQHIRIALRTAISSCIPQRASLSTSSCFTRIPSLASPSSGPDLAHGTPAVRALAARRLAPDSDSDMLMHHTESLICVPRRALASATRLDRTPSSAAPTTSASFQSILSRAVSGSPWSGHLAHCPLRVHWALSSAAPSLCPSGRCLRPSPDSDAYASHGPPCSVHTLPSLQPAAIERYGAEFVIGSASRRGRGEERVMDARRATNDDTPAGLSGPAYTFWRRVSFWRRGLGRSLGVRWRRGGGKASAARCVSIRCAPPAAVVHCVPSAPLPLTHACAFAVVSVFRSVLMPHRPRRLYNVPTHRSSSHRGPVWRTTLSTAHSPLPGDPIRSDTRRSHSRLDIALPFGHALFVFDFLRARTSRSL